MYISFEGKEDAIMAMRRFASLALAIAGGSVIVGLPSLAGATPTPVPQYIVQFSASALPPTASGLVFHSTSCSIGPATHPIVVLCKEAGTVKFTASGGSGTATVTSAMTTIDWKFTLHRNSASSTVYQMVGKGSETAGASPILRPVKVTGTLKVSPTPEPMFYGTEDVFPLPSSVA